MGEREQEQEPGSENDVCLWRQLRAEERAWAFRPERPAAKSSSITCSVVTLGSDFLSVDWRQYCTGLLGGWDEEIKCSLVLWEAEWSYSQVRRCAS